MHRTDSFTLVELLIVIGILAILSAATVIILNPAERLKESRDSVRVQELTSLEKSIHLLLTQNPSVSIGTASTVYISIPDTSATCANLTLPALPTGYAYTCVTAANLRNTNGTGWIPINFSSSGVSSLPQLPVDSVNSTSSGLYYSYTVGGGWALATRLESVKYMLRAASDGGVDPVQYEKGSNLSISSFSHGLLGYWKFDESEGTTAYDSSGWGNNGINATDPTSYDAASMVPGKIGNALQFDGIYQTVRMSNATPFTTGLPYTGSKSMGAWVYPTGVDGGGSTLMTTRNYPNNDPGWWAGIVSSRKVSFRSSNGSASSDATGNSILPLNTWSHIFIVYDGSSQEVTLYVNGVADGDTILDISHTNGGYLLFGGEDTVPKTNSGHETGWIGKIDEMYIYNRTLSAAEVQGIYASSK